MLCEGAGIVAYALQPETVPMALIYSEGKMQNCANLNIRGVG